MSRERQKIILQREQETAVKKVLAGRNGYCHFTQRVRQKQKLRLTLDCSIAKEIAMVSVWEGKGQTLLYCYKWGRGKHFVLRKIRKTAANKSIIARNRTRTSKEPWNKNGSKSTNQKLRTVTFWTLWNERLLPKSPLRRLKTDRSPKLKI